MRMRIDEPGHYTAPARIHNFCIANILFHLIARADALDLPVADKHSAVANYCEFRHLRTNARALWSGQRDNLRSVQDGE
ncbi:MAG: hypothetical protein AUG74_18955 [Bacteroidetes bacterium 13_1_20CM_4_60_6]|nr:MAG: hypothetical protein AUG74_18955 [Bacteroidetes bacterium 13_1_20CM_4_60_6]